MSVQSSNQFGLRREFLDSTTGRKCFIIFGEIIPECDLEYTSILQAAQNGDSFAAKELFEHAISKETQIVVNNQLLPVWNQTPVFLDISSNKTVVKPLDTPVNVSSLQPRSFMKPVGEIESSLPTGMVHSSQITVPEEEILALKSKNRKNWEEIVENTPPSKPSRIEINDISNLSDPNDDSPLTPHESTMPTDILKELEGVENYVQKIRQDFQLKDFEDISKSSRQPPLTQELWQVDQENIKLHKPTSILELAPYDEPDHPDKHESQKVEKDIPIREFSARDIAKNFQETEFDEISKLTRK